MKKLLLISFCICTLNATYAQDTFSIVAVDSVTGEVGSAGASCVDLYTTTFTNDFLGELFPGVGAINTQASYITTNQANARTRMNAGDSPTQIINWLVANDAQGNPSTRQYGIVRLVGGSPRVAGYTGTSCQNYKNHIAKKNYCIQGNILLGQKVLDSMEARFNREKGDLACKLMAALQGAKMVGADTRCTSNQSSSLFAFVKVSKPSDTFGNPSFLKSVRTHANAKVEPIDSLQKVFTKAHSCAVTTGIENSFTDAGIFTIHIQPNPFINSFIIKVSNNHSTKISFTIKDILGRKIADGQITDEKTIDAEKWVSGIYFVELRDGVTVKTRKIVRQ